MVLALSLIVPVTVGESPAKENAVIALAGLAAVVTVAV